MSMILFQELSLRVVVQTTVCQRRLLSSFSFLSWVQVSACLSRESNLTPLKELIHNQKFQKPANRRMDLLMGRKASRTDLVYLYDAFTSV